MINVSVALVAFLDKRAAEAPSAQLNLFEITKPLRDLISGMAVINGMATVIGGVSDEEFLRSIEVLDNSAENDTSIEGMDWRVAAHDLARPRYDFTIAQVPISAFPEDERSLDKCYDLADVLERFV